MRSRTAIMQRTW
uniref:Uncharacterized protein n=1 Tax=Anguilla anguilla TaxID=7936 RepID=A0A0E9UP83_ANGAN